MQLQIVADTTTVWSDGLVVGDAVEVEKFLHTGKAVVGEADVYLVGQPLIDIFVVSFATLGGALLGNEDELYIIALGNLSPLVLAALYGRTARTAAHPPKVDKEILAGILFAEMSDKVGHQAIGQRR